MSSAAAGAPRLGPRFPADAETAPYRAMLTLARELWVLRDRQRVLEALLAARGIATPAEIDAYEPPEELRAQLERECRAFVDALTADLGLKSPG
jgi:hypothetical protein